MAVALSKMTTIAQALAYAKEGKSDAAKYCPKAASDYTTAETAIAAYAAQLAASKAVGSAKVYEETQLLTVAKQALQYADKQCTANKAGTGTGTGTGSGGGSVNLNQYTVDPKLYGGTTSDNSWLWWLLGGVIVIGGGYAVYKYSAKNTPKKKAKK